MVDPAIANHQALMTLQRPAVFLDRDGILTEMVYDDTHGVIDSPLSTEDVVLKRAAAHFVRSLNELGFLTIVVTNQPGLARGWLSPVRLERIHAKLRELLAGDGARLDAIYSCPHDPSGGPGARPEYAVECTCRKPAPGLLLEAAEEHRVNLRRSYIVGAGLCDVEAGQRAGVTTILVNRLSAELLEFLADRPQAQPNHFVQDLPHALSVITRAREEMIAQKG